MTEQIKETDLQEESVAEENLTSHPTTDEAVDVAETVAEEVATEEDSISQLQAELETAQAEANKNLEGWQRAAADLANYKRRQEEQATRSRLDIKVGIIKDVLPVLDDLDLAFQNLPESLSDQETSWVEGFTLVQRKLFKMLDTHNVQPISTDGSFDPNLHEAITYEESPEHETNAIIAELRKGYITGELVIRPALVRVAQ